MPKPEELLDLLLFNRGISLEDKEKFLNPSYEQHLYDPYLLKDMERACVRIFEATEAKEKIIIYSDYDCDGIPAAVIMHDFFKKIGYDNFSVHIPNRHEDGYGLHIDAIQEFATNGVKLVVTFDLGITAIAAVAEAQALGIDVIITDHHLPQNELPKAYAIINPKQPGCQYPDKMLCGAGIAFKVVQGLVKKYGEYWKIEKGWEKWLLDMAGVATLSDLVPLLDENRALAYFGIKVLKHGRRPGLAELWKKAGVNKSMICEEDITFTLAPRLNAASRMGNPMDAFEVLATEDLVQARAVADHLAKINDERKSSVALMMKEVKKTLSKREERSLIVIGNPLWRPGLLGLVASKIVDEYKRPAFVWGSEGSEVIRGSCRGWGNINLVSIMTALPENSLIEFGGHAQAGGFSVSHTEIHFLEERLVKVFDDLGDEKIGSRDTMIDAEISLDDVTKENYAVIERLAPFGPGNPKPTFSFKDSPIASIKEFGKEKNHLELMFNTSAGRPVKAIAFFKTRESYGQILSAGARVDLVATFEKSTFMGRTELRLRIVDIL